MKKLTLSIFIAMFFIVGCQSAATPTPVKTAIPTAVKCTEQGWADILAYLYDFDEIVDNVDIKGDADAQVAQLEDIKASIQAVSIDGCTEGARISIIDGLDNRITGMKFLFEGNNASAVNYMHYGLRQIVSARDGLIKMGIDFQYPKK